MRFLTAAVSFLAALTAVAAQTPTSVPDGTDDLGNNAITSPTAGDTITAGSTYTIEWTNVRGGSVTLVLVGGDSDDLQPVATIVANVDNNGSYTWTVPEDIPASDSYAIRISYDGNPNNYNYSDRFIFESEVTATPTASTASSTTEPPSSTTESESSTTEASTTESEASTTTESTTNSTRTTTTRRPTQTDDEEEPEETDGAPPSAASSTLSSPLAVIMAVLAAALFIH